MSMLIYVKLPKKSRFNLTNRFSFYAGYTNETFCDCALCQMLIFVAFIHPGKVPPLLRLFSAMEGYFAPVSPYR